MRVLQFDVCDDDFSLEQIPANCVCYTGTHDNDTTVGWFGTLDEATQQSVLNLTGGSAETIHSDITITDDAFINPLFPTNRPRRRRAATPTLQSMPCATTLKPCDEKPKNVWTP